MRYQLIVATVATCLLLDACASRQDVPSAVSTPSTDIHEAVLIDRWKRAWPSDRNHTGSLVTTQAAGDPVANHRVDQETKSHEANNRFPHLLLPPPQSTAQER